VLTQLSPSYTAIVHQATNDAWVIGG
jgi:hypothetical protein